MDASNIQLEGRCVMVVKPSSYPENRLARAEFEWRAYEEYYSDQTLQKLTIVLSS